MTSIRPMAGKVLPGRKPTLPKPTTFPPLSGKVLPKKPTLPKPTTFPPMSGRVLPKKPSIPKKYGFIAAAAAGVLALGILIQNKTKKAKQISTQE